MNGNELEMLLAAVEDAAAAKHLTTTAAQNIRRWLTEPQFAEYAPLVARHIAEGRWRELDDAFWTTIPFGTGGRRGRMLSIGTATINDRTIGESAQGLADYVKRQNRAGAWSCAIAYDTRHRSREFAVLCAEIMAGNGFGVWFLDECRSTPELSFTVRHQECSCGIMITASHNPPSDNAIKAYWSSGAQLLPPHDQGVIDCVMRTTRIVRIPWTEGLARGKIVLCLDDIDSAYRAAVGHQSMTGPRQLKVVYSPMHGVGAASIVPVLKSAGFNDVEVFGPHASADGDFPNVPGHVANPENPRTFDAILEHAAHVGADLVMSTDPDADRLGCAGPDADGIWQVFNGNQIGALLTDYVLEHRRAQGSLGPDSYVVKTLVTTEMIRRIAESYAVRCVGELPVGFKYVAQAIDEAGPDGFVFGAEESHGYLAGTYARDKDATVAALLMAELAARVKTAGQTLADKLDALYWQHGCHIERQVSHTLPGAQGMDKMERIMSSLRTAPPKQLGGMRVERIRDYRSARETASDGTTRVLKGPNTDMVMLDLERDGNYVAVRPSGTEPKIKFYLFAYEAPELIADLKATKAELNDRLSRISRDLETIAT